MMRRQGELDGVLGAWWPLSMAAVLPLVATLWWLVPLLERDIGWKGAAMNPSEAIDKKFFAEAVRGIERGADPNRAYPVTGENERDPTRMMTPLETAVRRQELDVVKTLLRDGATADTLERQRLACLAATRGDGATAEYLAGHPVDAHGCEPASAAAGTADTP